MQPCKLFCRFSPELRLLLFTAKSCLAAEDYSRIRMLVQQGLEWDTVIQLAATHRTLPLLNRHLRQVAPGMVPPSILERLRSGFEQTVARNLGSTRELIRVHKCFAEHGISAIPFKGPLLAAKAYEHIGYRSFLDLDILVRKEAMVPCADLLERLGYERPANQTGAKEKAHLDAQLGFDFRRKDGQVLVELHWSLVQKWLCFHVEPEALWQRSGTTELAGFTLPVLGAEDNFLFLCAHGAKHQWERLIWISDIAEVLRTEQSLDWNCLLARARQTGSRRVLRWALMLAHDLLGAAVPEPVLAVARRDPVVLLLSRMIHDRLAAQDIIRSGPESRSDLLYVLGKERLADKCAYLFHRLSLVMKPTARDRQFARLPEALAGLYFLLRPLRVVSDRLWPRSRHKLHL